MVLNLKWKHDCGEESQSTPLNKEGNHPPKGGGEFPEVKDNFFGSALIRAIPTPPGRGVEQLFHFSVVI